MEIIHVVCRAAAATAECGKINIINEQIYEKTLVIFIYNSMVLSFNSDGFSK